MSDVGQNPLDPNAAGQELPPEYSVPVDAASLASHYERNDVSIRAILWFTGGLLVVLAVVHLVIYGVLRVWTGQPLPLRAQIPPADVAPIAVPGPGLDAAPETELGNMLRREQERLNNYGWIDRDAGTVRIPIERAMSLYLERGVATREGEPPNFDLEPAFRLDSSGGTWRGGEQGNEQTDTDNETTEADEATEDEAADE